MLKKNSFLLALLSIIFLVVNHSCEETLTDVGKTALPADGLNISTDTFDIIDVSSVMFENITTQDQFYPYIGEIYNNLTGNTKATLITQLFTKSITDIDSFNLISGTISFNIKDIIGDDSSKMIVNIYELTTDEIKKGFLDSLEYKYNSDFDYTEVYNKSLLISQDLDLSEYKDTLNNIDSILSIVLPLTYCTKLKGIQDSIENYYIYDTLYTPIDTLKDIDGADSLIIYDYNIIDTIYYSDFKYEKYKEDVGGLAIEVIRQDEKSGLMFNFDLYNESVNGCWISLELDDMDTTTNSSYVIYETKVFKHLKNYIKIENDYSGSQAEKYLNSTSEPIGFIKSMNGASLKIVLPEFENKIYYGKEILFNQAKIIFNQSDLFENNYPSYAYNVASNGFETDTNIFNYITDYFSSLSATYNGTDTSSGQYVIQIPHLIESIYNGDIGKEFYIYPLATPNNSYIYDYDRLLLYNYYGTIQSQQKNGLFYDRYNYNYNFIDLNSMKLVITYMNP